jgi:SMI1-KNR4 cell-wall
MINFDHTSPPLVDSDLDEVELRFGFVFPKAFREHYLKHNGGHPDQHRLTDENGTYSVHDFFPIKTSAIRTLGTLEKCIQWLKIDQPILPSHLVPFANDSFDNLYCFSTREQDYGAIYWLKMEGKRKPGGEFVAASLDDFLGKLRSKEAK